MTREDFEAGVRAQPGLSALLDTGVLVIVPCECDDECDYAQCECWRVTPPPKGRD